MYLWRAVDDEGEVLEGLSGKRHAILSVIDWADRWGFEPATAVGYFK